MSYQISIDGTAKKALRRIHPRDANRIETAIDKLADNPRPDGCTKLTAEDNLWRIRIGSYRVIYEIRDRELVVLVVKVAHRREAYGR